MESAIKAREIAAPRRPVGRTSNRTIFTHSDKQAVAVSDAFQVVRRAGGLRRPDCSVRGTVKLAADADGYERPRAPGDGEEIVGRVRVLTAPCGQLIGR